MVESKNGIDALELSNEWSYVSRFQQSYIFCVLPAIGDRSHRQSLKS
jgi:hypothetical protein